jgi:hypothetical protein
MVRSRRSAGIAATALVVIIIAAGCARGQKNDTAAGCTGDQADVVSAPLATTAPSATGAPTPQVRQDDEAAVCAAFAAYRKALQDRNAPAALALVPDSTIAYHDWLARVAGTGGPEEISTLSMIDRLTIAVLRIQYSTAELATMDGRQLFSAGVETGRIDSSTPADAELGTVRIAGDRAYMQIVADGTPTPVAFEFVYADGAWLVDVVAVHHVVNSVMEDGAQQAGLPENEVIFDAVESVTGQRIDESIFARP